MLLAILSGFLLLFGLYQVSAEIVGFVSMYEVRLSHIAIGVLSITLSLFSWSVGKRVDVKA